MKFELEFDKEIYRKQMDLLFDMAWKEKIAYYKNSHFLGLSLVIIGYILIRDRPSFFGVGFIILGLGILIPYLYYYFKIKSSYREIENAKTKEIEANQNLTTCSWEFTEEALITKIENEERLFNWKEFIAYFIRENNLLLITEKYEPMILGETEVGEENFKRIIDFVEKRIVVEK
jgi:Ca2+/Na+ antiporter